MGYQEDDADAVVVAFAQETGADLGEWIRRYPAYARDLTRAAASRWSGETQQLVEAADNATTARFREMGMAALRACRPAPRNAASFAHLLNAAKEKGLEAEALASQLEVPYGLLFKLHRRLLAPDSLPRTLVARLAEAIDRTADEVNAYLRQPPMLAAGASYRADDMPQVGEQESFAEALTTDPETTDVQRSYWATENAD